MKAAKTLTNPNKSGESGAADLFKAAKAADPLFVMPDARHLLPGAWREGLIDRAGSGAAQDREGGVTNESAAGVDGIDLTAEARKPEAGGLPLKNKRREEFCRVLTGWGGDGLRKRNFEAYEAVYGKSGATARVQSSWLLSNPEVKARVEWMERKIEEARRHDYRAAQQEIDALRLGLVERGKTNSKLAAIALAAARDFEAAHGLKAEAASRTETTEIQALESQDVLSGVRAILAKVVRRESCS